MDDLTRKVRSAALDLGFDLVGICKPVPPPHLETYLSWVNQGHHAGMNYLACEDVLATRSDPCRILPECQSILVTAKQYLPMELQALRGQQWSLAAYAAGDDYHDHIKSMLVNLVTTIEKHLGTPFPHKIYTDTGPILEKAYAQQAGLGWIGKNGCLINPELGSYFFLGEILLGLPLTADEPFSPDYCGSCSACLNACPTSCILPERTLDAGRCISYLTIEHRGVIPPDLQRNIGDWIFGCDRCQEVCPWNRRRSHPTDEPAFQVREAYKDMELADLLSLDQKAFQELFHSSPVKRAKLEGLLRNALIASGNRPQPELIAPAAALLHHSASTVIRQHAAWSLSHFPSQEARGHLNRALESEADPDVREAILSALENSSGPSRPAVEGS